MGSIPADTTGPRLRPGRTQSAPGLGPAPQSRPRPNTPSGPPTRHSTGSSIASSWLCLAVVLANCRSRPSTATAHNPSRDPNRPSAGDASAAPARNANDAFATPSYTGGASAKRGHAASGGDDGASRNACRDAPKTRFWCSPASSPSAAVASALAPAMLTPCLVPAVPSALAPAAPGEPVVSARRLAPLVPGWRAAGYSGFAAPTPAQSLRGRRRSPPRLADVSLNFASQSSDHRQDRRRHCGTTVDLSLRSLPKTRSRDTRTRKRPRPSQVGRARALAGV